MSIKSNNEELSIVRLQVTRNSIDKIIDVVCNTFDGRTKRCTIKNNSKCHLVLAQVQSMLYASIYASDVAMDP